MVKEIKATLSNGLRVTVVKDDELGPFKNYIWCNMIVGSGSASDPKGKSGLAHVTEHVARRKASENEKYFPRAIKKAHERRLITFGSAETVADCTTFPFAAETSLFPDVFKYYRAWFNDVPFNDDKYQKECINDVLSEKWKMVEKVPNFDLYDHFYSVAFEGHGYGALPLGREAEIRKLRPKDVTDFARGNYVLSNMHFSCLIGGAPHVSEERVLEEACKTLGELKDPFKECSYCPRETNYFDVTKDRFKFRKIQSEFPPALLMGFRIPRALTWTGAVPHIFHILLTDWNIFNGKASKTTFELSPHFEQMLAAGTIEVKISMKNEGNPAALKKIFDKFFAHSSRLAAGRFRHDELRRAREFAALSLERQRRQMGFKKTWPRFAISGYNYFDLLDVEREIFRISPGEITSAFRDLITKDRVTLVASVDQKALL